MKHVEPLETRCLLSSYTAASVTELIADINAANAAGGSNTITLKAGTTFSLTAVNNDTDGPTGLPVIAAGDDLTIVGNGDVIQRSTKRGTAAFRLFDVANGGVLTLNSLTLSGGLMAGSASGGGIFNAGTLNLNGTTVENCVVRLLSSPSTGSPATGGGISSYFGVLNITNCIIRNNQALGLSGLLASDSGFASSPGGPAEGGGIYVFEGNATVTNTTFSSNLARGGDGASGRNLQPGTQGGDGLGGAIYASGANLAIRGTSITANAATGGTAGATSKKAIFQPADGAGRGGGLYIAPAALVSLDSFTAAHTSGNTASTSDNDIFGSFSVLG